MSGASRSRSRSPARVGLRRRVATNVDDDVDDTTTTTSVVATASSRQRKQKKLTELEVDTFGGPLVKLFIMLIGPLFIQFAWSSCISDQCHLLTTARRITSLDAVWSLFAAPTTYSVFIVLFWFVTQCFFRVTMPSDEFLGYVQRDGNRLMYLLNGKWCLLASAVAYPLCFYFGLLDAQRIENELLSIATLFQIVAFGITTLLLVKARVGALGERSGSLLTDFFFGSEINPRLYERAASDVKFFLETHALIMWLAWDAFFAWRAIVRDQTPSVALVVTLLVHVAYVMHHFSDESFVLGIIDFTSENMGWMLTWGNLIHVGFYFPLSLMYVASNPISLSVPSAIAILLLAAYGLLMFSQSNHQKHQFRQQPTAPIWGAEPRALPTRRGTQLLFSGWWSIARKSNYTGDLLLALCHGLAAGFDAIMPHLYFLYLTALLIHRATRDDAACRAKYGADWDRYCALVPFMLIPGVW